MGAGAAAARHLGNGRQWRGCRGARPAFPGRGRGRLARRCRRLACTSGGLGGGLAASLGAALAGRCGGSLGLGDLGLGDVVLDQAAPRNVGAEVAVGEVLVGVGRLGTAPRVPREHIPRWPRARKRRAPGPEPPPNQYLE